MHADTARSAPIPPEIRDFERGRLRDALGAFTTAAASMTARAAGRLRGWLSARHSLPVEGAAVLALYGLYELARGLVVGDLVQALGNTRDLVALERSVGLFVEAEVQDAVHALPGLIDLLGISYLTLHLAGTIAVLLWLHQRRPAAFPLVRSTLVIASALALIGYVVFPTAPPRLSGIGIVDTVSGAHVDLNSGLVSSLYNPYAAVPSMHVGYALVVAASLFRYSGRVVGRVIGALYPLYVLLVVVATGNHFLVDALAGATVVGVAAGAACFLARPTAQARIARFPERPAPVTRAQKVAA
jgi:hypothetical protein